MNLDDSKYYRNRELSWLDFNERIIWEARNSSNPIMERCKFLAIAENNLDEFMMVRLASKEQAILKGRHKLDLAGLDDNKQYDLILNQCQEMKKYMQETYERQLVETLNQEKLYFTNMNQLTNCQLEYINQIYHLLLKPVLSPMAIDGSRPFPMIKNKTLYIALLLKKESLYEYVIMEIPTLLNRYIEVPKMILNQRCFVFIEDLIMHHLNELFCGYEIVNCACFRILRNASFHVNDSKNIVDEVKKMVKKRATGKACCLEVTCDMDERLLYFLKANLKVDERAIFKCSSRLDYTFLFKFYHEAKNLQFKANKLVEKSYGDIFSQIKKHDLFLHLPYESFKPVVDFLNQAANDPNVLQIKQTLYRVSENSPIIEALEKAARNGKDVSVLVEIKARFDEKNNLRWAKKLEKAGCHVIYGLPGLKTHSKITLVVSLEEEGIVSYVHLGTGNYNDATAEIYADLGIFTCNPRIGEDAAHFFNMLFGNTKQKELNEFTISPFALREKFMSLIDNEIDHAKNGKKAYIICKMNSLIDQQMIEKLYEASIAGVQIDLIVRGICGLKVGIKKVSENIRVRSIIGRYLEHSRIFYFYNDGKEDLYLSSADWMPRNFDRRVEILFPILEKSIKKQVKEILICELKDNVRASQLSENGSYEHVNDGKEPFDSQQYFSNKFKAN